MIFIIDLIPYPYYMKLTVTILKQFLGCLLFSLLLVESNGQSTIIPYGSSWKYWANTQANFPAGWQASGFDDSGWPVGNGELGYGDGDEATCIPSGGGGTVCLPSGNKWPAYYFRKNITIADPSVFTNFTFNVNRDDGFVVYVNGVEVSRDNIAAGPVTYGTAATTAVEDGVISFTVASTAFVAGNNNIAVEIHQASVSGSPPVSSSSDISFNLQLLGNDLFSASLTRGPYLQVGNQTSIKIRWRTATAQNSRIELGTTLGVYPIVVNDASVVTEHNITVTGLTADTKYYYRIGNAVNMQSPDANQFFTTLPLATTTRKIRVAAFGDCGRGDAAYQDDNLANYMNYLSLNGIDAPDAWILLGDNAYSSGTDLEYTNNFFNIYGSNILENHKLYPAPGNHDYGNSAVNKPSRTMPYHLNFSVPQNGEAGGVPSNKQNYYSYDIGNIHFLSLDSYGTESDLTSMETSGGSALKTWLDADLAANTKKWTIAYWHHPPYTKSSHNSDSEGDLVNIRQNFITFLETRGVDLIICGHSHAYERGYLLRNFTGSWTSFNPATHAVSTSSATYTSNTTCPYVYNVAPANHGTVYVVAGSAGASGGINTGFATNAMPFAVNDGGIFYFEVEDNRLDAKMLRRNGTVFDRFTIMKEVNKVSNYTITNGASQLLTASWPGNYNWNTAATTRSINVTPPSNATTNFTVTDNYGCITDQFSIVTSGVLPVHLLSFEAKSIDDKVKVDWSVSGASDVRFYTVERSADGHHFTTLGTVNSSSRTEYSYTDSQPLLGKSYYRLSQTTTDGQQQYLGIRKVESSSLKDFDVKALAADPGKLVLRLQTAVAAVYRLNIFDFSGRKLREESMRVTPGIVVKDFYLPPGIYVWEVRNVQNDAILQKVVIQ